MSATSFSNAGTSSWPRTPTTVVAVTWSNGAQLSVAAATRNGDSDATPGEWPSCVVPTTSSSWRVSIWFTFKFSAGTAQQPVNVGDQSVKILSMRASGGTSTSGWLAGKV